MGSEVPCPDSGRSAPRHLYQLAKRLWASHSVSLCPFSQQSLGVMALLSSKWTGVLFIDASGGGLCSNYYCESLPQTLLAHTDRHAGPALSNLILTEA